MDLLIFLLKCLDKIIHIDLEILNDEQQNDNVTDKLVFFLLAHDKLEFFRFSCLKSWFCVSVNQTLQNDLWTVLIFLFIKFTPSSKKLHHVIDINCTPNSKLHMWGFCKSGLLFDKSFKKGFALSTVAEFLWESFSSFDQFQSCFVLNFFLLFSSDNRFFLVDLIWLCLFKIKWREYQSFLND